MWIHSSVVSGQCATNFAGLGGTGGWLTAGAMDMCLDLLWKGKSGRFTRAVLSFQSMPGAWA